MPWAFAQAGGQNKGLAAPAMTLFLTVSSKVLRGMPSFLHNASAGRSLVGCHSRCFARGVAYGGGGARWGGGPTLCLGLEAPPPPPPPAFRIFNLCSHRHTMLLASFLSLHFLLYQRVCFAGLAEESHVQEYLPRIFERSCDDICCSCYAIGTHVAGHLPLKL